MLKVELDFVWHPVYTEDNVEYTFPDSLSKYMGQVYKLPSLYRWNVFNGHSRMYYVGETDNLFKRIKGYINPGVSQTTNIRMNSLFTEYLNNDFKVSLERMEIKRLHIGEKENTNHLLGDVFVRRLIENLIIVEHRNLGSELLNAKFKI